MNSKTTMAFGTITIVALVLLFASGPIVENQRALAATLAGSGLVGDGNYGGYFHHHHFHHH
jgi:hypothetical protein